MLKRFIPHSVTALLILASCNTDTKSPDPEKAKQEIAQAEKDFERMAAEKGIAEAFAWFADSNAVIKRGNDSLIHGPEQIRNFYSNPQIQSAKLNWTADFIQVSESGDFGYSYGKYTFRSKDSTGKENEYKGVFHTVWKRQEDGGWKYVWD